MLARTVRTLSDEWDWTADRHRTVYQRELLVRALEAAESDAPAFRDRLRTWRQRWAGLAEAGVRVAVDASAATARVVAETVEALAHPDSAWQFSAVPQIQSARGAPADESGSVLLAAGADTARPRARVAVRGGQLTEVEVRIDDLPADARSPLVLLMALDAGQMSRVQVVDAEPRQGATYRLARFSNLTPGEYVVVFEPLAPSGA
jgi:hypothetical protein